MSTDIEVKEAVVVNEIVNIDAIAQANGVGEEVALDLKDQFGSMIESVREYSSIVFDITLDEHSTEDNVKNTRKLKKELIAIEKRLDQTKKDLKADAMSYIDAIQATYNGIFGVINPMKKHLDKQINFEKLRQKKIEDDLRADRQAQLDAIGATIDGIDLGKISDEMWFDQFEGARLRKEESDRKAKAEAEENERIRKENQALQAERDLLANRQNELNKAGVIIESVDIGKIPEAEFREKLNNAIAEKEEADRKAQQERAEREEAQAKIDQIAKEKAQQEQAELDRQLAEQEAKEAEKRAGDIDRLLAWIDRFENPELDTDGMNEQSIAVSKAIEAKFSEVKIWAKFQAKNITSKVA